MSTQRRHSGRTPHNAVLSDWSYWRRSQQNSAEWLASKTVIQKEADTVDNDVISLSDFILHLMSLNTCDTYVVFFCFILLSCISSLYLNMAFRLYHDVSQEEDGLGRGRGEQTGKGVAESLRKLREVERQL